MLFVHGLILAELDSFNCGLFVVARIPVALA